MVHNHVAELGDLLGNMVTRPVVKSGEKLAQFLPALLEKAFFLKAGSKTTEAAMKTPKTYTGNLEIASFSPSYRDLTEGSVSATYPSRRKNGGPSMPGQLAFPAPYAYRSVFRHPDGSCG